MGKLQLSPEKWGVVRLFTLKMVHFFTLPNLEGVLHCSTPEVKKKTLFHPYPHNLTKTHSYYGQSPPVYGHKTFVILEVP